MSAKSHSVRFAPESEYEEYFDEGADEVTAEHQGNSINYENNNEEDNNKQVRKIAEQLYTLRNRRTRW